ncbi:hypothetical protein CRE_15285 [Caenorhabditis remanei]|uniref:Uncharacterized protein n=1 Tax=Caenorhabditis remanei TaxID=31234 RepID=E3MC08_CAERE|nr:hypothetical protein CRE_15285 [Caenorhabditis remanei]
MEIKLNAVNQPFNGTNWETTELLSILVLTSHRDITSFTSTSLKSTSLQC